VADDCICRERIPDLGGQLTHDGVGGERSDLCDLRRRSWMLGLGDAAMSHASAIMAR